MNLGTSLLVTEPIENVLYSVFKVLSQNKDREIHLSLKKRLEEVECIKVKRAKPENCEEQSKDKDRDQDRDEDHGESQKNTNPEDTAENLEGLSNEILEQETVKELSNKQMNVIEGQQEQQSINFDMKSDSKNSVEDVILNDKEREVKLTDADASDSSSLSDTLPTIPIKNDRINHNNVQKDIKDRLSNNNNNNSNNNKNYNRKSFAEIEKLKKKKKEKKLLEENKKTQEQEQEISPYALSKEEKTKLQQSIDFVNSLRSQSSSSSSSSSKATTKPLAYTMNPDATSSDLTESSELSRISAPKTTPNIVPYGLLKECWRFARSEKMTQVYFHQLVKGSRIYEEPYQEPEKSPELIARLKELRLQQQEKEYNKMTRNVNPNAIREAAVKNLQEIKSVKQQAFVFINILVSMIGVFFFAYYAAYYAFDFSTRVALASICSMVALLAEMWLYVKHSAFEGTKHAKIFEIK